MCLKIVVRNILVWFLETHCSFRNERFWRHYGGMLDTRVYPAKRRTVVKSFPSCACSGQTGTGDGARLCDGGEWRLLRQVEWRRSSQVLFSGDQRHRRLLRLQADTLRPLRLRLLRRRSI